MRLIYLNTIPKIVFYIYKVFLDKFNNRFRDQQNDDRRNLQANYWENYTSLWYYN